MLTDEQLVERVRKGKTRALDELYRRYAKSLYAFCATMSGTADSEDIVHDVFMRLIESAAVFNPQRASFRTWVFRIARNRCIDLLRHEQSLTIVSLGTPLKRDDGSRNSTLQETLVDHQETVEQLLVKEAGIDAVRDCIQALAQEEERRAIALYYLMGKVYREIGEILERSTSTAKNYVTSAREKVKRCLEGKGW